MARFYAHVWWKMPFTRDGCGEAGRSSPARPDEQVFETGGFGLGLPAHMCCRCVPGQLELLREDARAGWSLLEPFKATFMDLCPPACAR